ncbi:type II toxin-antitoxin system VapC family toxin [Thiorhodococcus minor]|uniref:Type II toxin-antitoxin system VapC family toxin n=1 Tax=Thiorhodococcus minor TaxID=57489 RepID=A0A6M0JTH4_9GAMM|nr:type II toxin-antitoxin system VapC family toxin [Thiorhodococcus minor]NEV60788.1 type II toxin-antitoxin system VapC family toxin [Thiorhodococcus minor]
MRVLLDTHAFLWWVTDDPRLSAAARAAIGDEANGVLVSAASAWEIATKHRLGKLGEAGGAVARFAELVTADGFEHLAVSYLHALKAGSYQSAHRDPFDRMLAAQSALEGLPLVTRDPAFADFGTKTLW